jgi:hypothetical protein
MIYVYQLAIRKADDQKGQFIIEHDMIKTETMLDEEFAKQTSEKYKCDVQITFLGELTPPEVELKMEAEYHTKEIIEAKINEWQEKQREEFTNATN